MALRATLPLRAARSSGKLELPRQVRSQAGAWERGVLGTSAWRAMRRPAGTLALLWKGRRIRDSQSLPPSGFLLVVGQGPVVLLGLKVAAAAIRGFSARALFLP